MNKAPHVWHWVCLNSEEELPGTSTNAPPLLFTSYEFATVPVIMCLVAQSCPTLCDPMACSPPGSSVHGDSPGKNTGVGCHALLQGIFLTQGSNPGLLHCRQVLYGRAAKEANYMGAMADTLGDSMARQAQPVHLVILRLHSFLPPSHVPLRCICRV